MWIRPRAVIRRDGVDGPSGADLAQRVWCSHASTLRYLRQFPVDIVKIDQGFIADIGREPTGTTIIDAVTNLAHVLGMSVTAEGIETQVQREAITAIGCENAQGFLYAEPMPNHELAAALTANYCSWHRQTSSTT